MLPLSNYDACDPFETMADVRRRAAMAKKKPAKKARKAREWTLNSPPTLDEGLANCEIIAGHYLPWGRGVRVREILPRKRAKAKRGGK